MIGEPAAVVTGLGALGAFGVGRAALAEALAGARPTPTAVARTSPYHAQGSARRALLAGAVDTTRFLAPLEARRMSSSSRFAVVAARAALEDARLAVSAEPDPTVAVALATAFGAVSYTQRLLDQIFLEGPAAASPALFTECVANAPAAQVGLLLRARGSSHTIVAGEAGPLRAVARGAAEIVAGRARIALAGAAEELTVLEHAILDRFRALARPAPDGEETARPFDRRRDGFVAAEGAMLLVLERAADAEARGATPLARVLAAPSGFDPTAPASGWGTGVEELAQTLVRGLSRVGRMPRDVDLIVSGASGSRTGDRLEALVLRRAWDGHSLPPILVPKATVGEYGGGFLGAAVLAVHGARFGPTPGFMELDADLGIEPHRGDPLATPRTVLVSSLAAGGPAAWLVLERP